MFINFTLCTTSFPIDFNGCPRLHHSEIPSKIDVALCCKLRTLLTLLKLLTLFSLLTRISLLTLLSVHTPYTFLEQNGYFGLYGYIQGDFFNWPPPEFAKCWPVRNRFRKNLRVPDWPPLYDQIKSKCLRTPM